MIGERKKVLLVAYLFPPIGGGGVQRALKMAKYLPEFGYDVHVLTVQPEYHATLDASLLDQLPAEGVHVHRVAEPHGLIARVKRALRPAPAPVASVAPASGGGKPAAASAAQGSAARAKLVQSLKRLKALLLIPDDQIVWRKPAVAAGLQLMREHAFDAIVSTSGPNTNHLVAQRLVRAARRQAAQQGSSPQAPIWIADFRDPWTQNMHRSGIAWREALEERMERSVHREADVTLTVTQAFADAFQAKYAGEITQLAVIHNGFDPADYANLQRTRVNEAKCNMIYAGIFYKERNPRLLLQAIHELIAEGKIDRTKLHITFAGVLDYPGYSENRDEITRLGLTDLVETPGNLPHKQVLCEMKNSDILLLVADTAPDSGAYIPGKLFEYMAIGNPILALSMEGESTRIIEKFGLGVVANPTDFNEIKQAVRVLYERWLTTSGDVYTSTQQSRGSTLLYERREQARLLAACIENANQTIKK